jgi:hopanoid biosynthesis associated RND transporter like protein HpnN
VTRLVRHATERPFLTIALCLVLAALSAAYTARSLTFQTSAVDLLPPDRVYVERFKTYLRDFGELNDIVIVVQAPELEQAKTFATRLAEELQRPPVRVTRVSYRVDPNALAGRALLYASTEQLTELRDKVAEHRAFVEAYAANPSLAQLVDGVNLEIARRFAGHFVDLGLDEPVRLDPGFIEALLTAIGERLESNQPRPSPWGSLFSSEGAERSGFFLSRDKKLLFMLVEPRREAGNFTDNQDVIAAIRGRIAALRAEFPGVEAGVTGTPALANDEMLTAFEDSAVASTLASVLTLLAVVLLFRRVVKPILMFLVLTVSLAWSMGLITLTVGHLTVFSVMFISLFVGIGIDYGIYFLFRYEEERGLGRWVPTALAITADRAGPGILFAALSAAGTFGVLTLTEFRGIVEFGFIAGLAILVAFLAMITLFPAVVVVVDRWERARVDVADATDVAPPRPAVRSLEWLTSHSRTILVAAGIATVASSWALPSVGFDYNRLNLQAKGTESAIWELKILTSGRSAFPALAAGSTLDELHDKRDAFARLPTVSDVVSILDVVPDRQAEKLDIIRDLAAVLAPLRVGSATPEDPVRLRAALTTLRQRLGLAIREAGPELSSAALVAADGRAQALLERLRAARPETAARLREVQAEFSGDFVTQMRRVQDNLAPTPMTVADLPAEVTRKFVGSSGAFLLQVYPSVNTWDQDGVAQFVSELRSVDPGATGSPVISYEAGRMMERAYFEGTLYALILVVALAAFVLRRWRDSLLAVLPMILGTLWTIGFMRLVGLSFNLANIWALPLIIGASAEYGLNVALRHREAMVDGGPLLARSTVMAVLLNGLTTIAGFGSLMVARHQGIFGLGLILTVGAVAGLAASLIVLPVLLRLLARAERAATGAGVRKPAVTLLVIASLGLPLWPVGRAAAGEPTDQVQAALTELYRLVSNSSQGTLEGRQRDVAVEVLNRLFDWKTMARQALRQHWDERTPAEQEEFTRLFAEVFRKAYLARINLVDASKFRYLGDRITGDRATVDTQVTTKRGSSIGVVYVVARAGGSDWRVEDVRVEGISLLDSYRTQFASIIARSSYETLVQRLRDRLKERG